jgi:hypothetical protein
VIGLERRVGRGNSNRKLFRVKAGDTSFVLSPWETIIEDSPAAIEAYRKLFSYKKESKKIQEARNGVQKKIEDQLEKFELDPNSPPDYKKPKREKIEL